MRSRWAVAANGVALLIVGWAISAQAWSAVAGAAGVLALAVVVLWRGWAEGATVVAAAFIAQLALAEDPNWLLVLVGTALLACFLAVSELYGNHIAGELRAIVRPHVVPVLAGTGAAVLAIVASVLPIEGDIILVAIGIAAAACVLLLIVAVTQE